MDQFLRVGHHLDNKISQGNDSTHMSDTLTDIKDNTGEYLICYVGYNSLSSEIFIEIGPGHMFWSESIPESRTSLGQQNLSGK